MVVVKVVRLVCFMVPAAPGEGVRHGKGVWVGLRHGKGMWVWLPHGKGVWVGLTHVASSICVQPCTIARLKGASIVRVTCGTWGGRLGACGDTWGDRLSACGDTWGGRLGTAYRLQPATCCLLPATHSLLPTTYSTAYHLQPAAYHLSPTAYSSTYRGHEHAEDYSPPPTHY